MTKIFFKQINKKYSSSKFLDREFVLFFEKKPIKNFCKALLRFSHISSHILNQNFYQKNLSILLSIPPPKNHFVLEKKSPKKY